MEEVGATPRYNGQYGRGMAGGEDGRGRLCGCGVLLDFPKTETEKVISQRV